MRTIVEILGVEKTDKYIRTYAVVDNGQEVVGFGDDFQVGDLVEVFYHEKFDTVKMRLPSRSKEKQ